MGWLALYAEEVELSETVDQREWEWQRDVQGEWPYLHLSACTNCRM